MKIKRSEEIYRWRFFNFNSMRPYECSYQESRQNAIKYHKFMLIYKMLSARKEIPVEIFRKMTEY